MLSEYISEAVEPLITHLGLEVPDIISIMDSVVSNFGLQGYSTLIYPEQICQYSLDFRNYSEMPVCNFLQEYSLHTDLPELWLPYLGFVNSPEAYHQFFYNTQFRLVADLTFGQFLYPDAYGVRPGFREFVVSHKIKGSGNAEIGIEHLNENLSCLYGTLESLNQVLGWRYVPVKCLIR